MVDKRGPRVIVYSKITGAYLRTHSGSYRNFQWRIQWKEHRKAREGKTEPLPEAGKWDSPEREEYNREVRSRAHKTAFSASTNEARIYASAGAALTSVGNWTTHVAPESRKGRERVMVLPEYLELHEVAGVSVYVNT